MIASLLASFRSGARRKSFLVPALLCAGVLSACSTTRGKANDLAEKGRFVEAAEVYVKLVQDEPNNPEYRASLDDLRWRGLSQLLTQARQARVEGREEDAEVNLEQFLSYKVKWNSKLDGGMESSLLEEMAGTHRHLRQLIIDPAKLGHALTAESHLDRKRALLAHPEMAPIRRDVEEAVAQGGAATCAKLKQSLSGGAQHWAELVSRYCGRYQQAAPRAGLFPEALGVPTWQVSVDGISNDVVQYLMTRLSGAFEASPWYSEASQRHAPMTIAGSLSERRMSEPVTLTAPWTERVPYTDHEDRTATAEVPYSVEESYEEKGVMKKRLVRQTKTVEYKTTVEVTKYRDVSRSFDYHAQRRGVEYHFAVVAQGVLQERHAPLAVKAENALEASGYEHNITFEPGGVRPQVFQRPNKEGWLDGQLRGYEQTFFASLMSRWQDAFCTAPAFAVEEAARCARGGVALPGPAKQALTETLGDDAAQVHRLFVWN
ncbi:putative lipoprotein [Corallococcus coralloides DSM 2259]|uniref:Putative lipoprotein n=1 Tax=Corallococcus coralloides (strain ATCC 25202 / DSM 2259 / NBRC 100086 / M2) TaxID=1144275 RepID=H8MQK1_CORCM|nr:hypothetical protein [Corallococcus coralloides]AFE03919.1 putative lipoprotein [Corallococcus coralloides DSM 2259]